MKEKTAVKNLTSHEHAQFDKIIGRNITLVREINRVTVAELAAGLNIPAEELQEYEAGKSVPVQILRTISRILGVHTGIFFAGI